MWISSKMVGIVDYDLIGEEEGEAISGGALRFRFSFVQKCLVDRWGAEDNLACSNGLSVVMFHVCKHSCSGDYWERNKTR
jgi:hypothetical protein